MRSPPTLVAEPQRWAAHPGPQTEFLSLGIRAYEALFGGAKGPGKTDCLLQEALRQVRHPRYHALLLRRTYKQLQEIMDRAHRWYPSCGGTWKADASRWQFPSGALISMGHVQHEGDKYNYQGHEYHYLGFDQLEQFTESIYLYLLAQQRRSVPDLAVYVRATANPGGIGHCVPFGEVLTPKGWKTIENIVVGEVVYAVRADGQLVECPVEQVHRHAYTGDLWKTADHCGLHMVCTPEHRVAKAGGTRQEVKQRFSLVPASQLPGQTQIQRAVRYHGTPLTSFVVPAITTRKRKLSQPSRLSGDQYAALMGWVLSEGCAIDRDKAFSITQTKLQHCAVIRGLLIDCGFQFGFSKKGFLVHAPDWWAYFRLFGKCRQKFIPRELLNASAHQLRLLLNALMDGDGHWQTPGRSGDYYTTSPQLADDVAEVGVKLGYAVSVTSRQRVNRRGLSYAVSLVDHPTTELLTGQHVYRVNTKTAKDLQVERVPYRGAVYDIGLPAHHAFVLRQYGTPWVSGNSWVKRRFINLGKRQFLHDQESGTTRVFIPATIEDNPSIMQHDPGYEARLHLGGEKQYRAFRWGDWEVFEGQFFSMWDPAIHVVQPFSIPASWSRFASMDYGYRAPSAVHWWANDYNGGMITYQELYREGLTYTDLALEILDRNAGQSLLYLVADPAIWSDISHHTGDLRGQTGYEIMQKVFDEDAARTGRPVIRIIRADNDRINGWIRMRERLMPAVVDQSSQPTALLRMFSTCANLIRTLPEQIHDEGRPEDLDTTGEDHAVDSARYACMSRPVASEVPAKPSTPNDMLWRDVRTDLHRSYQADINVESQADDDLEYVT